MSQSPKPTLPSLIAVALVGAAATGVPLAAVSQQAPAARPADKPPIAQGWIDIATFASPGMPGGMAGMMMGGGKAENHFGLTQAGGSGSYVDVTLRTSRNPSLSEALQAVPAGTKLAPTLQLKVPPQARPAPAEPKRKKKFGLKDTLDAVKDSVPLPN